MNKLNLMSVLAIVFGANDTDAWVPEYWANESIAILQENMVIGNLVHRDFEAIISESGDVVNTRKPGEFTMKRKDQADDVTVQDATATNVQVPLNQHLHVTFIIKDKEQSLAFRDLITEYLSPALLSIARGIDKILLFQAPRFVRADNRTAGTLGGNESVATILDVGKNLNDNKCPPENRNLIITTKAQNTLMKISDFLNAEKVGDGGTALREASLGRRLGFSTFMCQNTCYPNTAVDTVTGAVNNAAGYASGIGTMTVDGLSAAIVAGTWFVVAGDMIPHRVVSTVGGATPTSIVFLPTLKTAVADNAVITIYDTQLVNEPSNLAVGYQKYISYDGSTLPITEGQTIQFAAAGEMYIAIEATSTQILLDRPLVTAVLDNAVIFPGPLGAYNFAFVRNAIALVTRPMALPRPGTGAVGAVANYKGLSVRVVWSYDPYKQGTLVTVDILCGVAILDVKLGEVMFG